MKKATTKKATKKIRRRLEYLRGELHIGNMSYAECFELYSLAEYIDPCDVELLEAAGVPEFTQPEEEIE